MNSVLQDLSSALAGPVGRLRAALAQIEQLGGAGGLAGDPAELRRAAAAWRQQAAAIRRLDGDLDGQVRRTVSESWQGEASHAFTANWRSLSGKLGELAAGYDRMAAGLDQAAARADGLNSLASELVAEMEALLNSLQCLQDPAAGAGLSVSAGALVTRLEELLREVEAVWADFVSWALAMELWFQHLLQTVPRAQPVAVPRPVWKIGARLGPGGAVIELHPSSGGGEGGVTAARLRKGPPAGTGSLWRWLLVLLAAAAGHDAGVLARLIALASSDGDPKNKTARSLAEGESTLFNLPPNLGPPEEPPKNEKGEIDWEAWEARLRTKGVTGDLSERIAAAKADRVGALEELVAAERLANAGYRVSFLRPVENGGVSNPDISISASDGTSLSSTRSPLRVEVKSGNLNETSLRSALDRANRQIKLAEGDDPTVVAQQSGCVLYDARGATVQELDQADVEAVVRSKFTLGQFRQIRFLEVLYRDGNVVKRTLIFRNIDGSVSAPVTETLSSS